MGWEPGSRAGTASDNHVKESKVFPYTQFSKTMLKSFVRRWHGKVFFYKSTVTAEWGKNCGDKRGKGKVSSVRRRRQPFLLTVRILTFLHGKSLIGQVSVEAAE